jgi:hypothetical protein
MTAELDYPTLPQVDIALGRASLRRAQYTATGQQVSADMQAAVIDRLLDRRLVLMAERDQAAPMSAVGRTNQ